VLIDCGLNGAQRKKRGFEPPSVTFAMLFSSL